VIRAGLYDSCTTAEGVSSLLDRRTKQNGTLNYLFKVRLKETRRDRETKLQGKAMEKARRVGIQTLDSNRMGV